jgi:LmbE family N-acetylglucosaminyl deacetylase
MAIIFIILLIILLLWVTGFLLVTDLSVPPRDVKPFRRVLVIFPHADDEAIGCGGVLHRLSSAGCAVTLVILTKGEKGNPSATLDESLKDIRTREAATAADILGIAKIIQEDFGDGELHSKAKELAVFIEMTIEQEQPDLLITYDLAGFYGHADHITCSEVTTELQRSRFQEVPLWYVTFPRRVLAAARLPAHMRSSPNAHEKRAPATHRVFIGGSVLPKIRAWYTYRSQRASLTTGLMKLFPAWFFLSMMLFEYFAEARRLEDEGISSPEAASVETVRTPGD